MILKTKATTKAHKAVEVRSFRGIVSRGQKPRLMVSIEADQEWLTPAQARRLVRELEFHLARIDKARGK